MLPILLKIYYPLVGWTLLGIGICRFFPRLTQQGSHLIGPFLFWCGVPLSIIGFLRSTELTGGLWLGAIVAHLTYALGWGLSWVWVRWTQTRPQAQSWTPGQEGSFQLAAMLGNTGYIGYPICLAVGGTEFFGWALFFDMLGTLFGAYGLGVWVAARHQGRSLATVFAPQIPSSENIPLTAFIQVPESTPVNIWDPLRQVARSPAIWGFGLGIASQSVPFPSWLDQGLITFAWSMIPLTLVLLGMRMGGIRSWHQWPRATAALGIRLLIIPLVVGIGLSWTEIPPEARLMVVLQAGMPPATATLVLAETYQLDRELTVTALALGTAGILLTIPLWLWLWG